MPNTFLLSYGLFPVDFGLNLLEINAAAGATATFGAAPIFGTEALADDVEQVTYRRHEEHYNNDCFHHCLFTSKDQPAS